jgi:LPXTG-motif cell wall-anchored protein
MKSLELPENHAQLTGLRQLPDSGPDGDLALILSGAVIGLLLGALLLWGGVK